MIRFYLGMMFGAVMVLWSYCIRPEMTVVQSTLIVSMVAIGGLAGLLASNALKDRRERKKRDLRRLEIAMNATVADSLKGFSGIRRRG